MASISHNTAAWLLLAAIDLTVPAMVTWEYHAGKISSPVALISGLTSLAVLNAVMITAIRSRNKSSRRQTPRGFVIVAVSFAVFSGLLTELGIHSIPAQNDYLELALSNTPLSEIHPPQKAIVVELIRRNAAASKEYGRVAVETKPISPPLFSTGSFADQSVIKSVSSQFKKAADLDFAYYAQQQQSMAEFREKMMKADPDYLRSFDAARQEEELANNKAIELLRECTSVTLALYGYAAKHAPEIAVKNGQLVFSNENVRGEFDRQLENSKSLLQKWDVAHSNQVRLQQLAETKLGLVAD
jgi:hypothetical protein